MKNLLACLITLIAFSNCYCQKITIKDKNDLSPYTKELTRIFNTVGIFQNITLKGGYTFVTDENTKKSYVVGTGRTIEGNFVTFRSEAKLKSKTLKIDINESESCTGDNCETCKFASTGGCDCEKAAGAKGSCNHTITTAD